MAPKANARLTVSQILPSIVSLLSTHLFPLSMASQATVIPSIVISPSYSLAEEFSNLFTLPTPSTQAHIRAAQSNTLLASMASMASMSNSTRSNQEIDEWASSFSNTTDEYVIVNTCINILTHFIIIITSSHSSYQAPPPSLISTSHYQPSTIFPLSIPPQISPHLVPISTEYIGIPRLPAVPVYPLWLITTKPPVRLEPGILVRGTFGQGQLLCCWSQNQEFLYFICYTFDNDCIFLAIPRPWFIGWQDKLRQKCRNIVNRLFG
jgi:hypothetical protein